MVTMIVAALLRPDAACAWLLDPNSAVLGQRERPLSSSLSPAQSWLQLIETIREVCFGAVVEPAALERIALVFPGALDARGHVASDVAGFGGYDLARGLREHLHAHCEIVVASDTVADAWAQTQAGVLRDCPNWLYLGLDERIEAVACVKDAWLQPDLAALVLERDGPLDGRGRRGTFAAFCAGNEFSERARSYALNVAPAEVFQLAPSNFAAQSLSEDYVSRLAQGLAGGIVALHPSRVCIGGALGRALWPFIHSDLASELRDYLLPGAWNGDLALAAIGETGGIAPGALAVATLGAPPL